MPAHETIAVVEQDPDAPIERPILAQAILDISKAAKRLSDSGLNRRAVVALLHDSTRISKSDLNLVLDSLESLAKDYCK